MLKDYYKILNIDECSTAEDVKNAYRTLARKWHPDVAGNTPDVINKFKEINEAYEILSNSIKKADYDTARKFYSYSSNKQSTTQNSYSKNTSVPNNGYKETYRQNKKDEKNSFNFSWDDFWKKYNKTQKENQQDQKKGEDVYTEVEISIFDAINGTSKVINMLQTNICPQCKGRKFVNGAKCSICQGKGESSTYKRFTVKIPAGIKSGSKIRLAGEGEKGLNGGHNGDLYITVNIKEPQNYKTEGLNILKTVAISPFEAVLGGNIAIPTMKGNVSLKIAPNTRNGQKIRLSGCGIVQNNKVGDMIITVEIQIPKKLTNEEILLYKKLQDISSSTVREY